MLSYTHRILAFLGLLLVATSLLISAPAHAEDATINLTITGVECDLDTLPDPAPAYCNNLPPVTDPQPEVPPIKNTDKAPSPATFEQSGLPSLFHSITDRTSSALPPASLVKPVDSTKKSTHDSVFELLLVLIVSFVIVHAVRKYIYKNGTRSTS